MLGILWGRKSFQNVGRFWFFLCWCLLNKVHNSCHFNVLYYNGKNNLTKFNHEWNKFVREGLLENVCFGVSRRWQMLVNLHLNFSTSLLSGVLFISDITDHIHVEPFIPNWFDENLNSSTRFTKNLLKLLKELNSHVEGNECAGVLSTTRLLSFPSLYDMSKATKKKTNLFHLCFTSEWYILRKYCIQALWNSIGLAINNILINDHYTQSSIKHKNNQRPLLLVRLHACRNGKAIKRHYTVRCMELGLKIELYYRPTFACIISQVVALFLQWTSAFSACTTSQNTL